MSTRHAPDYPTITHGQTVPNYVRERNATTMSPVDLPKPLISVLLIPTLKFLSQLLRFKFQCQQEQGN